MSSQFLLSRCEELLAESVAIRLQQCGTGVQKCFDEHASLDTSQSQAQRDSATLKATHDDRCGHVSPLLRRIQRHETDSSTPRSKKDFTSRESAGVGPVGHTEQLKHQSLKLLCCKLLFRKPYSRVHFMRPCEVTMTTVGFMALGLFWTIHVSKVLFQSTLRDLGKSSVACDGASFWLKGIISNSGCSEHGRIRHCRARSETCCAVCHTTLNLTHSLERM